MSRNVGKDVDFCSLSVSKRGDYVKYICGESAIQSVTDEIVTPCMHDSAQRLGRRTLDEPPHYDAGFAECRHRYDSEHAGTLDVFQRAGIKLVTKRLGF
jgi:hypothetical protein